MEISKEEQQLIHFLERGETVVIDLHKNTGHKHVEQWAKDHDRFVYIGRFRPGYGSSRWRNPFKTGDLIADLNTYAAYLQKNPKLLQELPSLRGKALGCWCADHPCHGDVLMDFLNQLGKQKGPKPKEKQLPKITGDGTVFVGERKILLEERIIKASRHEDVVLKFYLYSDGTLKVE